MTNTYRIATFGSHSALQILKGAQDEGFSTVCICLKNKEKPYQSFHVADDIITIDSYHDFFNHQEILNQKNCILIPHASMIAYLGVDAIDTITTAYFGDKAILHVEAHRNKQRQWLIDAGLRVPQTFEKPKDIDRPCIVKSHGADGGRGYFLAKNEREFNDKAYSKKISDFFIQEYIVGVPLYIHYFYSPLTDELELLGFDRRYESNVDGIGRITSKDQLEFGLDTSYTVAGNNALVVRESLLPEIFDMGYAVVQQSKKLTAQGLYGAFCLETMVTSDLQFYVFEISARIVAGTNVHMNGSPYSYLRYNCPMSTGRRIARELKNAIESGQLNKVLG